MSAPDPTLDTIAAISTPPGRGGIGIVRLSGPESLQLASHLLAVKAPLEHARATFTRVLDPTDPVSYTHLDVYKRQALREVLIGAERREAD